MALSPLANHANGACTTSFSPITASEYVKAINPGWNLGNTLDAVPTEGSWNNVPVEATTFDDVKLAGFKSVRIPVTYADHYISSSPSWTINGTWLQRVSDVIDMAIARDLYVVTNVHHDSWKWADVTQSGANITMIQEKFYATWLQIASKLACKPASVAFEPINEPPATTAAHGTHINEFNSLFLKALANTGGFNSQRMVTLVGAGEDGPKTTQWFVRPANMTNPWALQYHYYSPYDFIFSAWGKTIWGSSADKSAMASDLGIVRGNFTDVPLIIGEYDASPTNCEAAARWRYTDYFIREATAKNTAVMIWDNGLDHLDRRSRSWRDPTSISIIMNAVRGVPNSLPDSTTDSSAATQSSSAYVFHKVGDPVKDEVVPLLMNGNTLTAARVDNGTSLHAPSDYSLQGSSITFTTAFLSKYLSSKGSPGSKANVTLMFSQGASFNIEFVQWDVPLLSSTSSKAVGGSDLNIPVVYKGLRKLAAVRIIEQDNTPLFDTWTQNLGPLQRARGTYNNHWNFDESNVIITSSAVQAVIAAGKPTTFSFEFYPRVPGNSVNYTLTI